MWQRFCEVCELIFRNAGHGCVYGPWYVNERGILARSIIRRSDRYVVLEEEAGGNLRI